MRTTYEQENMLIAVIVNSPDLNVLLDNLENQNICPNNLNLP